MKNLIIVGAGGFGLEVALYAKDLARFQSFNILGFIDDYKPRGSTIDGLSILGSSDDPILPEGQYIVAVGSPEGRCSLAQKLAARGATFTSLLHPLSYIAENAHMGVGIVAAPFAFVGARAEISDHTLLNIHSTVGHEAKVGRYTVLSPYADINGAGVVKESVFLGSHACIMPGLKIGQGSKIAAGAVVYNDIPEYVTALGNPAAFRTNK